MFTKVDEKYIKHSKCHSLIFLHNPGEIYSRRFYMWRIWDLDWFNNLAVEKNVYVILIYIKSSMISINFIFELEVLIFASYVFNFLAQLIKIQKKILGFNLKVIRHQSKMTILCPGVLRMRLLESCLLLSYISL